MVTENLRRKAFNKPALKALGRKFWLPKSQAINCGCSSTPTRPTLQRFARAALGSKGMEQVQVWHARDTGVNSRFTLLPNHRKNSKATQRQQSPYMPEPTVFQDSQFLTFEKVL